MTTRQAGSLRVLSVASECYPFIKTGGLADVVGALPVPLAEQGVTVTTLIPGYRGLRSQPEKGLVTFDQPALFDRDGGPYLDVQGRDWPDNLQRFNAFGRFAARVALGLESTVADHRFDVLHLHDWQAAATIPHLDQLSHRLGLARPATLLTIHNLAFQGRFAFPAEGSRERADLGLFDLYYGSDWLEFYGSINLLKAAILKADAVTTVSPTYAAEITTPAFGEGLDAILRHRGTALSGILNGLNLSQWDPTRDSHLTQPYDLRSRAKGKAAAKAAMQRSLGLDVAPERPLFGLVSRLSQQKGIDLLLAVLPRLLEQNAQLVVLGSGERDLEQALVARASALPRHMAVHLGYSEALAHQIHAASDFLLVPSRFEPCGLTQLSAQAYGALPIVSPVGGLRDSVIHASPIARASGAATGLMMREVTALALAEALDQALALFADRPAFARVQKSAMALTAQLGWATPAAAYAARYRDLIASSR